MKKKLEGKVAAITGASSGIGRATAIRLAREGASIALIARNRERLEEAAREVRSLGEEAEIFIADTTVDEQVTQAVEGAIARFGHIDIFHCNAGIYFRKPVMELTMEQIRHVFETNFYGNLRCAYAVLPHFLQRGGGSLVVTASMDSKKGFPPDGAYAASKFAINGFMQVLRQELRGSGVKVSMIFPGRIDTPMIDFVDCPAITAKVSPEKVADGVLKAVLTGKPEIYVPHGSNRLMVWVDALSPRLSDYMVRLFHLDGTENERPPVFEKGLHK